MDKVAAFVFRHGEDDFSIWWFDLPDDEMEEILGILNRHETEGYSVRGDGTLTLND